MTAFEHAAALLQEGQLAEAVRAFERVLEKDPGNGNVHYHASVALAAQGHYEAALEHARRAAELLPDWWRGHAQTGAIHLVIGQPFKALPPLKRAHALAPNAAEVLNNIGAALRAVGGLHESIAFFEKSTLADPDYVDAARNLANALSESGRAAEAIVPLERLLERGHASADLYDMMGKALWKNDRIEDALVWFDKSLALDPKHASAMGHRGNAWMELGKIEEGKASLRAAIDTAPERGEFYHVLAGVDPAAITEADLATLERLAAAPGSEDRSDVDYALSRVYDHRGESARAFRHLLAANAAVRAKLPYDEAAQFALFDRLTALFTPDVFARVREGANPSERPIFIVGMPRSGTTLIEQILASHPSVYGAGELDLFTRTSDLVLEASGLSAEVAIRSSDAVLREIADRYLAGIAELAPSDALRVTDKMPNNFLSVGLIALVFPNAHIIHTRRNPLDTCISCFSINFASAGLVWTCDLSELGRYYRRYERLMEHWRAVLPPGRMLEVRYEETVEDLEAQARRVVAFCGLPWDERCLEFHTLKRPIKTASVTQVRRPIYRTSVNRAERYGDLIAPLKDALGL
jgi:tetratricopeptide (TPR) repeat protein